MTINVRKLEKNCKFYKKNGKIREVENHSTATRNYKITYYCDTKSWKNKYSKNLKNFWKLELITVFMFGVAIHIALKTAIKSNYVLQKTFTNFYKPQFHTGPTKNPKKRRKNFNILGSKTFF